MAFLNFYAKIEGALGRTTGSMGLTHPSILPISISPLPAFESRLEQTVNNIALPSKTQTGVSGTEGYSTMNGAAHHARSDSGIPNPWVTVAGLSYPSLTTNHCSTLPNYDKDLYHTSNGIEGSCSPSYSFGDVGGLMPSHSMEDNALTPSTNINNIFITGGDENYPQPGCSFQGFLEAGSLA